MLRPVLLTLSAVLVFVLCGVVGGPGFAPDVEFVHAFAELRSHDHAFTKALIAMTWLGSGVILLPAAIVASLLVARTHRRTASVLLFTTLSARGTIEWVKWWIARPRPSVDLHPVYVVSESFPSGHAGNSMATYVGIALFAVPERWRPKALVAAITLSILIGLSRPMLGVHWPTDVIAGWAFGLLWVSVWSAAAKRITAS